MHSSLGRLHNHASMADAFHVAHRVRELDNFRLLQQPVLGQLTLSARNQPGAAIQLLAYLFDLEKSASTEALGTMHIGAWHLTGFIFRLQSLFLQSSLSIPSRVTKYL